MFRPRNLLMVILLMAVAGCNVTAPSDEMDADKVTASMMARQYQRLVRSYSLGSAQFSVYRPWSLLTMIKKAPNGIMNESTCVGGLEKKDDRGSQDGIRILVYRNTCAELYFHFLTNDMEYLIGPNGWSGYHPIVH